MTKDGLDAIQRELSSRWCLAYDTIGRRDIGRLIQWPHTYPRLTIQRTLRFFESPIGRDPDKRDYPLSTGRILSADFRPDWSLKRGIRELADRYTIMNGTVYSNV